MSTTALWWRDPALVVHQDVADFYTCRICTQLLLCPVELPGCGHMYCRECWEAYREDRFMVRCPECRQLVLAAGVMKSNSARRFIEQSLQLRCASCNTVLTMGTDGADARSHAKRSCVVPLSIPPPSALQLAGERWVPLSENQILNAPTCDLRSMLATLGCKPDDIMKVRSKGVKRKLLLDWLATYRQALAAELEEQKGVVAVAEKRMEEIRSQMLSIDSQ